MFGPCRHLIDDYIIIFVHTLKKLFLYRCKFHSFYSYTHLYQYQILQTITKKVLFEKIFSCLLSNLKQITFEITKKNYELI